MMRLELKHKSKTIFWDDIWEIEDLTKDEKFMFIYLIGHYNPKEGYAFPSVNKMVKELKMSKPTVLKVVKSLEQKGYIKIMPTVKDNGEGKSSKGVNQYVIQAKDYMCYDENKQINSNIKTIDQKPVADKKENKKVEEQLQQDQAIDEYYTPAGNVEGQMDISEYDSSSVDSTNNTDKVKEVNTMYDSYKDIYELALINGMNSILSPSSRFGLTEYAKAHGLVVPQ